MLPDAKCTGTLLACHRLHDFAEANPRAISRFRSICTNTLFTLYRYTSNISPALGPLAVPVQPSMLYRYTLLQSADFASFLAASTMSTVQLSYSRLFRENCEKLHMETPECVVAPTAEGAHLVYIDLPISRSESIFKIVRCWWLQCSTSVATEHEAARVAIKRMVEELDLQVKDMNYDDSIFYKNLYNHLSTEYAVLFEQYNNLLCEYNFVKD